MSTNLKTLLKQANLRQIDLARELGIDKSLVTRWSQKRVPAERAFDVMRVTGIPLSEIRPDLFGRTDAKAKRKAAAQ